MPAPPSSRLVAEAWESLFRAQVAVLRDLGTEFPDDELRMVEYDVLFNLSRIPGHIARPRDLQHRLLLSQPSLSRLLERLAERGLVTKTPDPDDRRGVLIALTPEGLRAFRTTAVPHTASILRRFGDSLDADELRTLIGLCDRIRLGRAADATTPREPAAPAD